MLELGNPVLLWHPLLYGDLAIRCTFDVLLVTDTIARTLRDILGSPPAPIDLGDPLYFTSSMVTPDTRGIDLLYLPVPPPCLRKATP